MTVRFRSKIIGNAVGLAAAVLVTANLGGSTASAQQPQAPPASPASPGASPTQRPPQTQPPATNQPSTAREQQWTTQAGSPTSVTAETPLGVVPPADYVIGAEDVLSILYWRDKDMTADVAVRPDGKITLPLLGEIAAGGLTPIQLRDRLLEESKRYIEDPNISVVVKQINSRKVFIMGEVGKPGPYQLIAPTTVLQLLAMAGGLKDFANAENIKIIRNEKEGPVAYRFNYKGVASGKVSLRTNIELKVGDTIIVP